MLGVPTVWPEKVNDAGVSFTVVVAPVPVRPTVWIVGLELSVMVTVPVLAPGTVGVKMTAMRQVPPAATLAPQLLVCEKSPLALMLLILINALPVFVSVKV